jgi:hypothetical protein
LEHVNSPHLRFLFDPANFVQVQVQPMTDAYPYVKDFIEYVHIKDALMNTGEVVPPGEGDGELRALIAALKERNYSGFMSIEPHLEATSQYVGYSNPQLFRIAAQALKQLLSEAGVEWNKHPNSTNEAAVLPPPCISAQAGLLISGSRSLRLKRWKKRITMYSLSEAAQEEEPHYGDCATS